MKTSAITPEMESLKTRLKRIWMAGDYDRFSRYMEDNERDFYERLNIAPGCRLLDVGCGSGKLAIIAAKNGLEVTGTDIANNLGNGHEHAQAEGLQVRDRRTLLIAAALRAGGAITHGTHAMKET